MVQTFAMLPGGLFNRQNVYKRAHHEEGLGNYVSGAKYITELQKGVKSEKERNNRSLQ